MAFSNVAFKIRKYRVGPRILSPPFFSNFWFGVSVGFSVAVGQNSKRVFHDIRMRAGRFLKEIHTLAGNIDHSIQILPAVCAQVDVLIRGANSTTRVK
jgi:hypothetical protein